MSSKIKAIANYYNASTWNEERWQKALMHGLKEIFLKQDNLRAIYRYVNRLIFFAVQFPREINIIDLIAIESIRMFYPKLYLFIYRNKGRLTGGMREIEEAIWGPTDREKEQIKEEIAKNLEYFEREAISLTGFLFPRLSSLQNYGEASSNPSEHEISELRICSQEHFDKYFIYHLSSGAITQLILEDFI